MSVLEDAGALKARATDFSIAAIMGAAAKLVPVSTDGKLSRSPSPRVLSLAEEDQDPPEVSSSSDAGTGLHRKANSPPMGGGGVSKRPRLEGSCNCEDLRQVHCHLETKELWDKFHELGTEMIITKT
ncbi:unnamed protein product, partial [Meganyctiphanes norvegica]